MRNISIIFILTLLILTLVACGSNEVDTSDNVGLEEVLKDNEAYPNDGVTLSDETDELTTERDGEITLDSSKSDTDNNDYEHGTVPIESNTNENNSSSTPSDAHDITDEDSTEDVTEVEPDEPFEDGGTDEDSSAESESESETLPEEEPYDGMEVEISDSKKIISEAYNAGTFAGYSVAKGSAKIIQPSADNPNIIQIVFETDDPNICIAVNYYRTNENSQWKLITGTPISIIDLSESQD